MAKYLSDFLNRFSMYKVVSLSLTVLFVFAFVLSLLGILAYSPLAMLTSVGVIGFSVFLTSILFGYLFGVRVHIESSFITGMILFFIFTPTLEMTGLLALAVVGCIAGASKFLLVYRGRHVFNPVAIAAAIAALAGLEYASWWVATPLLVPLTLVLGFFIIQKTRRVPVAGTFMGISVALVMTMLLIQGNSLSESFGLLFSWPIFFFSAFMLTEPLTLPPKKWQQVIEAVIVALLFSVPLQIGDFTMGPAFALIAGNLFAFIFVRQGALSLTYETMKPLTPSSFEFAFRPKKKVTYQPGQYLEMTIVHKKSDFRGERRSFSITSAPGSDLITIGVKFYEPSSSYKKVLKSLEKGLVVTATGIRGDFTLPKDLTIPLLFIAGGIGITPFISQLRYLASLNVKRDITLLYAVNNESEIAYKDVLSAAGIKVVIVTKQTAQLKLPNGWTQATQPVINQETIATYVPDSASRNAYISGPPLMIDGVKNHLKKLNGKNIKTDYFIGY